MTRDEISLEWLQARTRADGDCLLWALHVNVYGLPQTRVDGKNYPVRRLMWEVANERKIRGRSSATVTCENPLCVNPDHLAVRKKKHELLGLVRSPVQKAKIAKTLQAKSRWTDDVINEIRSSTAPLRVLAEQHGMHLSYVHDIRNGKKRRDMSNPFSQLFGRAA